MLNKYQELILNKKNRRYLNSNNISDNISNNISNNISDNNLNNNNNNIQQIGSQYIINNKNYKENIDFTSNDYLGVNQNTTKNNLNIFHQQLKNHLQDILNNNQDVEFGATGSRLISGKQKIFSAFEQQIAIDKQQESALIFNSGYQANSTVLASLLQMPDVSVFCDKLNHASLHHACRLAGVVQQRYPHLDYAVLEKKLAKSYENKPEGLRWIVTETVFGMDGDSIDLEKILHLAQKYQASVYLDEAHATGLFGVRGYGLSTALGTGILEKYKDVAICVMGTFGKALGTAGAYIALPAILKDYLINYCTGFIYSTAGSPLLLALTAYVWQHLPQLHQTHAARILELADFFKKDLEIYFKNLKINSKINSNINIDIIGDTHICILRASAKNSENPENPENLENNITYLKKLYKYLIENKIAPSLILPPTAETSLRFAFCAQHTFNDVEKTLNIIKNFKNI